MADILTHRGLVTLYGDIDQSEPLGEPGWMAA